MIQRIDVSTFLKHQDSGLILDVRSPGEYEHAHIPGAVSLPLFSDAERKVVGTAYKQESRETAIKIGLDYFGPRMRAVVEQVEALTAHKSKKVLVHCWRGGMRSGAIAWLLDLYGFEVYLLDGGYKAFRNWVLAKFEIPYSFKLIGGYTGSGKTPLLEALQNENYQIVDLEALASHKGSALGGINLPPQPSQEMFENQLAVKFSELDNEKIIYLEDESQRIGDRNIPAGIWKQMQQSQVYFLDIPFEKRLDYLLKEYGSLPQDKLVTAILRIQKRLGGLETKNAIQYTIDGDLRSCYGILLKYYDKWYHKGLFTRPNAENLITKVSLTEVEVQKTLDVLKKHL